MVDTIAYKLLNAALHYGEEDPRESLRDALEIYDPENFRYGAHGDFNNVLEAAYHQLEDPDNPFVVGRDTFLDRLLEVVVAAVCEQCQCVGNPRSDMGM